MNDKIIISQINLLLSMLTPLALRNIGYGIADMIEDATDLSEFDADPNVVEPIFQSIRLACDSNS